ncbi:hypothetical protein HHUSO_G36874 [Huso huso]|uniref:Uncharacterized protein n=1 Tax=Huso huso TaxID=61971 RepID=A0ABR0Y0V9_HUSHU
MKIFWSLICVFILAHDFRACSGNWLKPRDLQNEVSYSPFNATEVKPLQRKKRFVGALIQGILEVTESALTIANAVTGMYNVLKYFSLLR